MGERERDPAAGPAEGEAVCFSSSANTMYFGAGTVHAWLAADRAAPTVVAGVSAGNLNAAVLQQACEELATSRASRGSDAQVEATRWRLLRRFVGEVCDEPIRLLTRGLPSLSSLLTRVEESADAGAVHEGLAHQEREARVQRARLHRLGLHLASSPVRIGDVAAAVRAYVAMVESLGLWRRATRDRTKSPFARMRTWTSHALRFGFACVALVAGVLRAQEAVLLVLGTRALQLWSRPVQPLPGWLPTGIGLVATWSAAVAVGSLLVDVWLWHPPSVLFYVSLGVAIAVRFAATPVLVSSLARTDFLAGGLLRDYPARRRVTRLFRRADGCDPTVRHEAQPALLAALTALEGVRRMPARSAVPRVDARSTEEAEPPTLDQFYARHGAPLVDVLMAGMAIPGVLPAQRVRATAECAPGVEAPVCWLPEGWTTADGQSYLHLVDASVVRSNPLPSLFRFLTQDPRGGPHARRLEAFELRGAPAIHVVFGAPDTPLPETGPSVAREAYDRQLETRGYLDIVDVTMLSLDLSRRIDLDLEIEQTSRRARLESLLPAGAEDTLRVTADAIAPEEPIALGADFSPQRPEALEIIANGCRRTLEKLYARKLEALAVSPSADVACATLLAEVAPDRALRFGGVRPAAPGATSGLPEVCDACPRRLRPRPQPRSPLPAGVGHAPQRGGPNAAPGRPTSPRPAVAPAVRAVADVRMPEVVTDSMLPRPLAVPRSEAWRPRIVFVASGGVFRGTFHVGMLAAFEALHLRPDVVFGASVGSLMGAIGAAMWTEPRDGGGQRVLERLTDMVLDVRRRLGVTHDLVSALRELGIAAESVVLSPDEIWSGLVKRSRDDPSFGTVGAPSVLVDAISTLLLVPHEQAARATARLVAGHGVEATEALLAAIKTEALPRLGISRALLGTSLLEPELRQLLRHVRMDSRQPFARDHIAFFATASNLRTQEMVLFGLDDHPEAPPYDFARSVLASAAFPAVFAPVPESDILPGSGRWDVHYADGGLFDNLPFLPALDVLGAAQAAAAEHWGQGPTDGDAALKYLKQRHERPDLLVVGALDVPPERTPFRSDARPPTTAETRQRAGKLSHCNKIQSMARHFDRMSEGIGRLVAAGPGTVGPRDVDFVNRLVSGVVHPVYPLDEDHLNGTFHFTPASGLSEKRLAASMANGCFETLRSFARPGAAAAPDALARDDSPAGRRTRALAGLVEDGRSRIHQVRVASGSAAGSACPYFETRERETDAFAPLRCPFAAMSDGGPEVHRACVRDVAHQRRRAASVDPPVPGGR